MKIKLCRKCNRKYPATSGFFHRAKESIDGLKNSCKKCLNEEARKYRQKNKKYYREYNKKYYIKKKENVKDYNAKRYAKNKEYHRRHRKVYYQENKERENSLNNKYKQENRKSIRDYNKVYYQKNKDYFYEASKIYYQENKEALKKYTSEYTKRNPEKVNIHNQRRKSRLRNAHFDYKLQSWEMCKKHFNHKCAYCGSSEKLEFDHFIPLSKGGEFTTRNIVPACKSCNSSKHNHYMEDWFYKQDFYSKEREKNILGYLGKQVLQQ